MASEKETPKTTEQPDLFYEERFWEQYVGPDYRGNDHLAAPMRAKSLRGLPTALILTAEVDPIRDDAEAYAALADLVVHAIRAIPSSGASPVGSTSRQPPSSHTSTTAWKSSGSSAQA